MSIIQVANSTEEITSGGEQLVEEKLALCGLALQNVSEVVGITNGDAVTYYAIVDSKKYVAGSAQVNTMPEDVYQRILLERPDDVVEVEFEHAPAVQTTDVSSCALM